MTDGAHHSRRRQYPQQQYDFNAPAAPPMVPGAPDYVAGAVGAAGVPVSMGAPMGVPGAQMATPGVPLVQTPGTPSLGQAMDGMTNQFGQVGLDETGYGGQNAQPQYPNGSDYGYGAANGGAGGAMATPKQPLNQLYNVDLLQSFPPPIADLDLPPPPLVVPQDAAVMGNVVTGGANGSPDFIRSTLNVVPTSSSLLKKSKLPFALVIRPYTSLLKNGAPVPVVDDAVICRCRRCRCYINPFVQFVEQQQNRWKCSMCGLTNEVPNQFDYDPVNNVRKDRWSRPELNYGVYEFLAPPEYMVRAPQPPVFVFVLDCSVAAVTSGLLATAARTIQEALDRIPNADGRARVAFIAVDQALHFFSLPVPGPEDAETPLEPSVHVVSDLDDPFLPLPSSLLVNLNECRGSVEKMLGMVGDMFAGSVCSLHALGSALKAAHRLIGSIGGKIVVLSATLPNAGVAKLEQRNNSTNAANFKDASLLQPANSFYKSFAVECNRSQVTVDMFLCGTQFQDVASLSSLPRFTAGQTYFYPGWSAARPEDAIKLAHELTSHLSMDISMEAVLRVRASTGLRMNAFYGNFFNRSSDLCSFPTFPRDQSYVVEVAIEETLNKPWVCLQAGVLHTTCDGERRIRVLTVAIPTSSLLQDVYASVDQQALMAYYTHRAVDKALSSGIQSAHDYLNTRLQELFQTYRKELMTTNVGASAPLQFSANLRMLPLLINGLLKHLGLRKSPQIPVDLRAAALALLSTLPLPYLIKYLYPSLYCLHEMPDGAGDPDPETGKILMPPKINLSGERIVSHGLYLIDDGQTMFLWVGRDAVPQLLQDAFGVLSMAEVRGGKTELAEVEGSDLNRRIRTLVAKAREKDDQVTWQPLFVVKEDGDPSLRLWASSFLVEDRTDQAPTYQQMLAQIREKISS